MAVTVPRIVVVIVLEKTAQTVITLMEVARADVKLVGLAQSVIKVNYYDV